MPTFSTIRLLNEVNLLLNNYPVEDDAVNKIASFIRQNVSSKQLQGFSCAIHDKMLQDAKWHHFARTLVRSLNVIAPSRSEDWEKAYVTIQETLRNRKIRFEREKEMRLKQLELKRERIRLEEIAEEKRKKKEEKRRLELERQRSLNEKNRKKEEEKRRLELERQRSLNEKNRKKEEEKRRLELERQRLLKEEIQSEIKASHDNLAAQQEYADLDRASRQESLWGQLRHAVTTDYLSADSFFDSHTDKVLVSPKEFQEAKYNFVKHWIEKHTPENRDGNKYAPDDEQTVAIATIENKIQVIARAGSGKTSTLGGRAHFLIKHCRVNPEQMLLLAFNSKAAMEMRRRLLNMSNPVAESQINTEIERRIQQGKPHRKVNMKDLEGQAIEAVARDLDVRLPHIMTFHALAYAVVKPKNPPLYDDENAKVFSLSRVVQQIIDDHIKHPDTKGDVRKLMLAHFKEDWDRILQGGYDITDQGVMLDYRRSLPRESLGGDYVKSYGEKKIADFLFEHDIPYKYERNHYWDEINYRPDFTIFKTTKPGGKPTGIVIEYFGLEGDPDYDEMSQEKRRYWEGKDRWELLEFTPKDITHQEGGIEEMLKQMLEKEDVQCRLLPEDAIWEKVKDRAVDRFSKAVSSFIGRCRMANLRPDDLKHRLGAYDSISEVEKDFVDMGLVFYRAYIDRLANTSEDDFDGLIQKATEIIRSGQSVFPRGPGSIDLDLAALEHIFIDEFQDFSLLFHELISSIRESKPEMNLFAVGDDWQSINGFAGSDLRFFQNFKNHWGSCTQLNISTNYRSFQRIVSIGNSLMRGLGIPAAAHHKSEGRVTVANSKEFKPSKFEQNRHSGDIFTPAVLRIINQKLSDGKDVVMLSRCNKLPYYVHYLIEKPRGLKGIDLFLEHIRSFFSEDLHKKITISTAHKYKGLEKKSVIILDAVERSYPLIHPDWILTRVFGDSLEKIIQEERRLMYVALTRAEENLYILTDNNTKSPFLIELEQRSHIEPISWSRYPPVKDKNCSITLVIGNQPGWGSSPTFNILDHLKASGYHWKSTGGKGWAKVIQEEMFDIRSLESEVWFNLANGVEIQIFNESDELKAVYHVSKAKIKHVT